MITPAKNIQDWFTKVPPERVDALYRIRDLIRTHMPGVEESLHYKMPSYGRDGKVEMAFNSQKNFIALYVMKQEVMQANAERLKGVNCGKGCVRFPHPKKIDWDLVEQLIKDNAASAGIPC